MDSLILNKELKRMWINIKINSFHDKMKKLFITCIEIQIAVTRLEESWVQFPAQQAQEFQLVMVVS